MLTKKIAIAFLAVTAVGGQAQAFKPNKPSKPVCHQVKTCHTVGPTCSNKSAQTKKAPCPTGSTTPHEVCTYQKVCD